MKAGDMLVDCMGYLSLGTGFIGVVVITCGTIRTLVEFIRLELKQLGGKNICPDRELMRHHFGSYILLGLEFLIAADIIHTITQPGLEELAALGVIVAIRTVLSVFLNREMETHSCEVK